MSNVAHESIDAGSCGPSERRALVERISPLYRWYEPEASLEVMEQRLCAHPGTRVDLLIRGGVTLAFAVCVEVDLPNDERCLFRHGTIVGAEERSQGLYKQLLQIGLDRHRPQWHACRTQNPRVYEAWERFHGPSLLPHPDRTPPMDVVDIARYLSKNHPTFDSRMFTVKDVYPHNRSGSDYHRCRTPWIQDLFAERLGVHDAMILLARL